MDLYDFNPWWETGEVSRRLAKDKKRDIYSTLEASIEKRRIDVITGLRRVGKTTVMYQLIQTLLNRGINPRTILYYSFDLKERDIPEVINHYEEKVLKERIRNKKIYLFLDEVHKLNDWANKIKVIYDLYPQIKIVLSGSASLGIMKNTGESLAGRAKYHYMPPLTFREYLKFTDKGIPQGPTDYELHARSLGVMFERFRLRGFPETVDMDEYDAKEYVRELVVERVIYRDIPECFHIEDIEIVRILADYILENPGVIINIDSLSRDLKRHRKTIRNALQYLEMSYIIRKISNLRGSFLATSRKNRKAYPEHVSLCSGGDEDRMLECFVRSELKAQYYWRKGGYEVDFIIKNGTLTPIEVKNKEDINKKDMKPMIKFMELYGLKRGFILYNGSEERNVDGIVIMPILKFALSF